MNTPLIAWSPDLEIGHTAVDNQHRKLFDLAATLVLDNNIGRVMAALAALSDYVVVHFRDEEKLMAEIGFPGIEAHRRQHEIFKSRLAKVYQNAGALGIVGIADEVRELVNEWLTNHIMVADREYSAYIAPPASPAAD